MSLRSSLIHKANTAAVSLHDLVSQQGERKGKGRFKSG